MQMQRHLQEPSAECANLNVAGNHQNAAVGLPPTGVQNDAMQRHFQAFPAPEVRILPHGDAMQMQRHLQEPSAECANLNVAGNHQNAAVGLPPTGVHNDAMQRRFQGPSAKNLNVAQRTFLQPAGVQNDAKFGNGASIPLQSWDCEGIESDSMFSGDGEEMTELLGSKHGDEEETMKLLGNPMPLTVSDDVMAQSTSERRSKAETNQSRNEATKQKKQQQQQKKRKKAALENVQHNSKKQQQQQNRKGEDEVVRPVLAEKRTEQKQNRKGEDAVVRPVVAEKRTERKRKGKEEVCNALVLLCCSFCKGKSSHSL